MASTEEPSLLDPQVSLPAGPPAPWHVRFTTGELAGPATSNAVYDWLRSGRLTADAWVWHDGWSDWRPAGAMFLQLRKDPTAPLLRTAPAITVHAPPEDDLVEADLSGAMYRSRSGLFSSGLAILLLATCAALLPVLGWAFMAPPVAHHGESASHEESLRGPTVEASHRAPHAP